MMAATQTLVTQDANTIVLKVATLNARGLRRESKIRRLIRKALKENVHLLFLQETNWEYKGLCKMPEYPGCWMKHVSLIDSYASPEYPIYASKASTNARGVAICVLKRGIIVKNVLCDDEEKFLSIDISIDETDFRCISVHLSPRSRKRINDIKTLSFYFQDVKSHFIVAGDFNLIFSNEERTGTTGGHNIFMGREELGNLLNPYGLIEADNNPLNHTRFNKERTKSTKLDRIYISKSMLTSSVSNIINPNGSDHKMVISEVVYKM